MNYYNLPQPWPVNYKLRQHVIENECTRVSLLENVTSTITIYDRHLNKRKKRSVITVDPRELEL